MGRRIVITSFGSLGDLYPYIGLGLGLKQRGHDVVLATAAFHRAAVLEAGLGFHPVRPDIDPYDRALVARIMDARRGTEFIVRDLILPSLRDSFRDLLAATNGADLLVTHPITFAAPIVAQHTGTPWASTVLAPMSFFSPHDLPVFPPMPWAKRLERVPGAARALVKLARAATSRWMEPVHALRRELGLPPAGDPLYEAQHSPVLALALFSRVLGEPQPDWPATVEITGAIPYNGTGATALSPDLRAFLEDGPAPIVFTLGSSAVGAAGDFYEQAIEAVRQLGARAVLLVGPHPENQPRTTVPAGVRLEAYAPHAALFPHAAVIVHQGGIGTLHQALRAGRPTLIAPFAHDQPDNAWRVARLGVSRTLSPRRFRAERVVRELTVLLDGGGHRERAAAVGTAVRSEDGVAVACDLLADRFF